MQLLILRAQQQEDREEGTADLAHIDGYDRGGRADLNARSSVNGMNGRRGVERFKDDRREPDMKGLTISNAFDAASNGFCKERLPTLHGQVEACKTRVHYRALKTKPGRVLRRLVATDNITRSMRTTEHGQTRADQWHGFSFDHYTYAPKLRKALRLHRA